MGRSLFPSPSRRGNNGKLFLSPSHFFLTLLKFYGEGLGFDWMMIGKYGIRMGNTQRFTKFFLGLLFSRSGVKQKETWIFQGLYKNKKRPYVARKMCATQGLKFLFFLGFSEDA